MEEYDYMMFAFSAMFVGYKAVTSATQFQPPSMAGMLATLVAVVVLGYEVIVIASRLF